MSTMETFATDFNQFENYVSKIRSKNVPERFDADFLNDAGIDIRYSLLYVSLFRRLGLIDNDGYPTEDYHSFIHSDSKSHFIVNNKIKDGYKKISEILHKIHKGNMSLAHSLLIADTLVILSNFVDVAEKPSPKNAVKSQREPTYNTTSDKDNIPELVNDVLEAIQKAYKIDEPQVRDKQHSGLKKVTKPQLLSR